MGIFQIQSFKLEQKILDEEGFSDYQCKWQSYMYSVTLANLSRDM